LQDTRQHQTHEEGEAEQQGNTQTAVLVLLDGVHEAPGDTQEQHESDEGVAGKEAELHLDADQGADDRWHHAQGEQHVGIAQHAILLEGEPGGALREVIEWHVHPVYSFQAVMIRP
jgi:hypothetical protein